MLEDAAIRIAISDTDMTATCRGQLWPDVVRAAVEKALHSLHPVRAVTAHVVAGLPFDDVTSGLLVATLSNAALSDAAYRTYLDELAALPLHESRAVLVLREPIDPARLGARLARMPRFDLSLLESADQREIDASVPLASTMAAIARCFANALAGSRATESDGVFVAPVGAKLESERDRIMRELAGHGRTVHGDSSDEASMRRALERCTLSVHLFDDDPSADRLVATSFHAALAEATRRNDFTQLVWLTTVSPEGDTQRDLVETAFECANAGADVEVIRTGIEQFKTYVIDRLRRHPATDVTNAAAAGRSLYIIFDRRDAEAARSVEALARDRGIDVILSSFDIDQVALRERHQQSLRVCDAAIIVYGRVTEPWVRMKQQDLLKAAGFGRARSMCATAILLAPDPTPLKSRFQAGSVPLLRSADGLREEIVVPFLERILNS